MHLQINSYYIWSCKQLIEAKWRIVLFISSIASFKLFSKCSLEIEWFTPSNKRYFLKASVSFSSIVFNKSFFISSISEHLVINSLGFFFLFLRFLFLTSFDWILPLFSHKIEFWGRSMTSFSISFSLKSKINSLSTNKVKYLVYLTNC